MPISCQMWVKKHTFGSLSRIFREFGLKLDYKSKELCNFVGDYDRTRITAISTHSLSERE